MSFDIKTASRVQKLTTEINEIRTTEAARQRLADFSSWGIFAGRDGGSYRLERIGSSSGLLGEGGYYLTNLVLQGGGTLGLAHAGLVSGLEQAGFRFPAIAGTSAGAIVASGIFALRGDNILDPVGPQITDLVSDIPMDTFVDGPRSIRRLVKRFSSRRNMIELIYLVGLWRALRRIIRVRGLNTGSVFELWMDDLLTGAGLPNLDAVQVRATTIVKALQSAETDGENPFNEDLEPDHILKMITTAMPTGMKFALPRDMKLLHGEYRNISAARMVRMSMSIPIFFEPCVLSVNAQEWSDYVEEKYAPFVTDRMAARMKDHEHVTFLDGGLFSNLPTDELVDGMSDQIASISAPLVRDSKNVDIQSGRTIRGVISDGLAVASAVRLQRDRDAHTRIIDVKAKNRKIMKIDTGESNWLNFNMNSVEKEELYVAGLTRARDFLVKGV